MSRAARAPSSGSRSRTVMPEPRFAAGVVNSAPRSRARPATARRAWWRMAANCLARSSGPLVGQASWCSSLKAQLRPGFGLVLELPGGPVGAVGEGEGEPAGLAGFAGAHAAGSGQRVDDRQAAATLGVRPGFGVPGGGRGAVGDFAGDAGPLGGSGVAV